MRYLITGITGQDGSYLAEQLKADGHEVWGMVRRASAKTPSTVIGDLTDQASLERVLAEVQPDVVFNLAAITSPGAGWGQAVPPLMVETTGTGVVHLLEAMLKVTPKARLVHASSSAVFDQNRYGLYGAAKQLAHAAVQGYRPKLFASNAVFYSHTSPRQDKRFLAPRIVQAVLNVGRGRMVLGDVDSQRDWGFAPDFCKALRAIARHGFPGDYVVASGETHSVLDMADAACNAAGVRFDDAFTIDPHAAHVPHEQPIPRQLLDATRALGWEHTTGFDDMVKRIVKEG